jgi:hypothetical protein
MPLVPVPPGPVPVRRVAGARPFLLAEQHGRVATYSCFAIEGVTPAARFPGIP